MCQSSYELLPFCDECLGNVQEKGIDNITKEDLCADCRQNLKHFCWCCMTVSYKGLNEDGLCPECANWLDPNVIPETRYDE
jgi:hypothetical protein